MLSHHYFQRGNRGCHDCGLHDRDYGYHGCVNHGCACYDHELKHDGDLCSLIHEHVCEYYAHDYVHVFLNKKRGYNK